MLKSWFISLFVLILLALAYYINLFDWLATGYAMWLGIVLVAIMLLAFITHLVFNHAANRAKHNMSDLI